MVYNMLYIIEKMHPSYWTPGIFPMVLCHCSFPRCPWVLRTGGGILKRLSAVFAGFFAVPIDMRRCVGSSSWAFSPSAPLHVLSLCVLIFVCFLSVGSSLWSSFRWLLLCCFSSVGSSLCGGLFVVVFCGFVWACVALCGLLSLP